MQLVSSGFLSQAKVEHELKRLAYFGASLVDAHSCFLLLPNQLEEILEDVGQTIKISHGEKQALTLAAYYSRSSAIVEQACLPYDSGILGWVAKNQRPIQVTPFDRDSRTLGTYNDKIEVKSLVALPIQLNQSYKERTASVGVLACDSLVNGWFTANHLSWLHDLTSQIAVTVRLLWQNQKIIEQAPSWETFQARALELIETLGINCVDILRVKVNNIEAVESQSGTARCVDLIELFTRLVNQALPPYCPSYRLPNGDLVIVLDNMLSAFIENKVRAIANHIATTKERFELSFFKTACLNNRGEPANLSHLLSKQGLALSLPRRNTKCG